LVHGDAGFRKMRWRVDMGTVLPDHLVKRSAEAVLGDGVGLMRLRIAGGREFGLAKTRPDRRLRAETVGEIDEGFGGDDAIGAHQVRLVPRLRWRDDHRQRAKRSEQKHSTTRHRCFLPGSRTNQSGSGMNSVVSPGTISKRPAFQSALAASMRSLREETKFHQMWRGPSMAAPPTTTTWASLAAR